MEIKIDLSGALAKTATLQKTPQAARKCLQKWGAETVLVLMRSAAGLNKTQHKGGGALARSVQMKMDGNTLIVGTNVKKKGASEKYARIQDEGGDIVPRTKKFLTVPFPGVKDRATDYKGQSFFITTKSGALLLCMKKGKSGLKPLFFLTKHVRIQPSHWFSRPMFEQLPELDRYMDPDFIYDVAQNMAGTMGEKA